jgi:hypothetical protein
MSKQILHVLRNPYGWCEEAQREARIQAADLIESQAREIEEKETRIDQLEWENKGVDEWRGIANELRAEIEHLRISYDAATMLVAKMHEAAVGKVIGPHHGVVEDVANIRAALVVAVDALDKAEWSNRKIEELGRMAGATDADLLMDKETVFSKALTRCKEVLGDDGT